MKKLQCSCQFRLLLFLALGKKEISDNSRKRKFTASYFEMLYSKVSMDPEILSTNSRMIIHRFFSFSGQLFKSLLVTVWHSFFVFTIKSLLHSLLIISKFITVILFIVLLRILHILADHNRSGDYLFHATLNSSLCIAECIRLKMQKFIQYLISTGR